MPFNGFWHFPGALKMSLADIKISQQLFYGNSFVILENFKRQVLFANGEIFQDSFCHSS